MTQDEWDAESLREEEELLAGHEARLAELAPEMANMLTQVHRHLLQHDLHEVMYDQPNGKDLFQRLDALVDQLAQL